MKKLSNITQWHFITLFMLVLISLGLYYHTYNKNINEYKTMKYNGFKTQLQSVLFSYDLLTDYIYNDLIDNPKVTKILYDASQTDDKVIQSVLRTKLHKMLLPLYDKLHALHIRQFHFHLPKSISFLRFHRYKKFGDSLIGIRPSIAMVNKNHKKVSGFEEGRALNGFRNVFPIFHNDIFVGSVELSFSFVALKTTGMKLYPASYRLILQKKRVEEKVWKNEQSNYKISDISSEYYYDKQSLKSSNILSNKIINALNRKLQNKITSNLREQKFFSYFVENDSIDYLISFMPLQNISGDIIGYFIIYNEDNNKATLQKELYGELLSTIFFGIIVSVLLLLYRRHKQVLIFAKEQQELSQIDALTQISNRAFFQERAPRLIEHAKNSNYSLGVIFFDIDHFKNINDTYGHNTGDLVLQEITQVVKSQVREEDCFSRWGGEEFVLVLSHTSLEDTERISNKIRDAVNSFEFSGIKRVSCSFGITLYKETDTLFTLMERADDALYRAKHEGRDCIRIKL